MKKGISPQWIDFESNDPAAVWIKVAAVRVLLESFLLNKSRAMYAAVNHDRVAIDARCCQFYANVKDYVGLLDRQITSASVTAAPPNTEGDLYRPGGLVMQADSILDELYTVLASALNYSKTNFSSRSRQLGEMGFKIDFRTTRVLDLTY